MTDSLTLRADKDLAGDLAIELALAGLGVQLADNDQEIGAVYVTGSKERLYSLEFSNIDTLIITGASTATALLTFAQTLLQFLRDRRREKADEPVTVQPSVVVNNDLIVTADLKDAERMLATYLQENEIRQIVIAVGAAIQRSDGPRPKT